MGRTGDECCARMGSFGLRHRRGVLVRGHLFGSVGAENGHVAQAPPGSLTFALFPEERLRHVQIFRRGDFDVLEVAVH